MAKKLKSTTASNETSSAAVALNCQTDLALNETWKSKVNATADGEFRIFPEDAFGYFDGLHTSTQTIKGHCSGTNIWFVIPADDPRYLYKGTFQNPKKVKGTRTALPAFTLTAGPAVADDPWEADKTT
jgi:hypothetical protein